jgi:hypothetical protein
MKPNSLKLNMPIFLQRFAMSGVGIFVAACALASCSNLPINANRSSSGFGGDSRFLQQVDLTTSKVSVQMNLPNADACILARLNLRKMWAEQLTKEYGQAASKAEIERIADRSFRCGSEDLSSTLRYRSTQRVKANGLLLDAYSISLEQCQHSLGPSDSSLDVVSDCKQH